LKAWLYSVGAVAGFLVVSYLLIRYAFPVLAPFILAAILAQLIEPVVTMLEFRGRVPRGIAAGIVILLVTGGLVVLIVLGISRLVHEIRSFAAALPYYYALGVDISNQISERLGTFNEALPASLQGVLQELLQNARDLVTRRIPGVMDTLLAFTGLPLLLINLMIALVATFFLSRDRGEIYQFILRLMPTELRPQIRAVKVEVWTSALKFARAQAMLIALTTIQTMIMLSLIGSNYAVSVGLLVGVADILPLLGPATIFVPWIAYHFLFGTTILGLKLLVIYVIIAGVRQVLEPKIVGEQIGLHPLATLFSLFLGFQFFGAVGFIVGPLLAILLKAMVSSGLLPIFREEPITK
jgi:sporulation integral membrane protein YtvI